jgi:hypothetical protein
MKNIGIEPTNTVYLSVGIDTHSILSKYIVALSEATPVSEVLTEEPTEAGSRSDAALDD